MRRAVPLLLLLLPLAFAACDPNAHDESLLSYAVTGLWIAALGLAVGLVVLGVGLAAFCASATTLALNVFMPSRRTRIAGLVAGGVDLALAALALAVIVWLGLHRTHGATLHVDLGALKSATPVLALGGLGVANCVLAAFPGRRAAAGATSARVS